MAITGDKLLKRVHPVSYVRGIPEFADEVRKTFKALEGKDFVLAVDLPHGLEMEVLRAVKRLPKPTLLLDPLKRGILVIPSCAAIEAVRSFLYQGCDYHFIDASLPVSSSPGDWRRFAEYCKEFGQDHVFERSEEYGIDISSLVLEKPGQPVARPFLHIAGHIGSTTYSELLPPVLSQYFEARQHTMAMHLHRLLDQDREVMFVCSERHLGRVMEFLKEPAEPFDDPVRLPVIPCRLRPGDLAKVSPEIPWFVGLYERWRTEGFSRRDALIDLLAGEGDDNVHRISTVFTYAMNLALSEAQVYPDLFSLITAAQLCAGDDYAFSVLERAQRYPYDDPESNCQVREFFTWDFERTEPRPIPLHPSRSPDWLKQGGEGPGKKPPVPWGIFHFTRTLPSLAAEREFMRYLERRYVSKRPSESFRVEEFTAGLRDGIDCQESLRPRPVPTLYVREQAMVNTAAYVVDFGDVPTWQVYFDSVYHMVGAARRRDASTHTWVCFVAFLSPPKPMEELIDGVDLKNPRESCLDIALAHADHVFLFTDTTNRPLPKDAVSSRVRVIDLQVLPRALRESMRWFHVAS